MLGVRVLSRDPLNVFEILSRLLSARALAAVASLCSTLVAYKLLPKEEFVRSSLVLSAIGAVVPVVSQPFAKYALVALDLKGLEMAFYQLQPVIYLVFCALFFFLSFASFDASIGLILVAALFATTQGLKEFSAESSRVRGEITVAQRIYTRDSYFTLLLTILGLLWFPVAEIFILMSGISSLVVFAGYVGRRIVSGPRAAWTPALLVRAYRYAAGVVVTSFSTGSVMTVSRAAIAKGSTPELAAAVQLVLDLAQKPMAILASSVVSSLLPVLRRGAGRGAISIVSLVMTFALIAFCSVLLILSYLVPEFWKINIQNGILPACVLFAWANRYRVAVLDLPLSSLVERSHYLMFGAFATLAVGWLLTGYLQSVMSLLIGATAAFLIGGGVSCFIYCWIKSEISPECVLAIALPVIVLLGFTGFALGL